MTDREAFVQKICENPLDQTVRLVYADWLEDHDTGDGLGTLRAALVRDTHVTAEVAEAARNRWAELWPDLARFCDAAHRAHAPLRVSMWYGDGRHQLLHGSRGLGVCVDVRGGFAVGLHVPLAQYWERGGVELFGAHPIVSVRLTDRVPMPSDAGAHCLWQHGSWQSLNSSLPSELFNALSGTRKTRLDWWHFPHATAAHMALGRACVGHARRHFGLPELYGKPNPNS